MSFLKKLNANSIKESLADGVKSAQKSISNIDVTAIVKNATDAATIGAKAVQEGVSNIDVGEAIKGAKDAATSGIETVSKTVGSIAHKSPKKGEEEDTSFRKFIELLWCMAYADETITEAERETLNELSSGFDENYEAYRAEIEDEFAIRLEGNKKEFGNLAAVKIEAKSIIESLELTPAEAKLLCWNLLALASSDGLDDNELDLIRFIGKQSGLEASIVEELRNYSDTILEIARAREQLKQSTRSYSEIEPLINELANREQALIEAAQSLIADR